MSVDLCAVCGVYGLPMKRVGLVMMCVDNVGCAKRKASRVHDNDDDRYLVPLEGPNDPSVPHVVVSCSRGDCRMSFFVDRTDPRLPDGPFLCADHDDVPTKFKIADHVEASVACDLCSAQLAAVAPTREAAIEKLWMLVNEQRWRVIDRLSDRREDVRQRVPDLCCDCAAKL